MSCRKRFLFIPFLCFFFSLFFSFILEKNSFAISDYHVDIYDSDFLSSDLYICGHSPDTNIVCSDYDYIIIDYSNTPTNPWSLPFFQYNYVSNGGGFSSTTNSPSVNVQAIFPQTSSFYFDWIGFHKGWSSYSGYISVTLTDTLPGSSIPSGTLPITSNGQYDVTQYEYVDVNVENEIIQGDYHDDLVSIKHAIITCGGVILVLYFFYCIYRMIIKNSGVH